MDKNGSGQPVLQTVFTFVQEDRLLRGEFQGDTVIFGQILGHFVAENQIELHLQWICRAQKIHWGTLSGLVSGNNRCGLTLFVNWERGNEAKERGWASFRELLP